jgi:hypothetical protein
MPSQEQQSLRPRLWVWGNSTLSEKVCGTEFEFSQRERRRLRGILRFAENGWHIALFLSQGDHGIQSKSSSRRCISGQYRCNSK